MAKPPAQPGFNAPDIQTLLRQRAEWLEGLEEGGAVLRSDDLSSCSSVWDGEDADHVVRCISEEPAEQAVGSVKQEAAEQDDSDQGLDDNCISFVRSREYFADSELADEDLAPHEGSAALPHRKRNSGVSGASALSKATRTAVLEPPRRRLQRVRAEVDALCVWAASRSKAREAAKGSNEPIAVEEARILREDMDGIAKALRDEVPQRSAPGACMRMWLPTDAESDSLALLRDLVDYSRHHHQAAGPASGDAGSSTATASGGAKQQPLYKFTAHVGKDGGWRADQEVERCVKLRKRVDLARELLGCGSGAPGGDGAQPLATAVRALHRRLETLQQVDRPEAAERLSSSAQLLAADVEVAIAEARHFDAVEREAGPDLCEEESLDRQLAKLRDSLASLDSVAVRVADTGQLLIAEDHHHDELLLFSRDLRGAEARAERARELLQTAAEAAKEMQRTLVINREQMEANVGCLDQRLIEWQARANVRGAACAERGDSAPSPATAKAGSQAA